MVKVSEMARPFYILALDGGGAKGIFSLGVLKEFENLVDKPLYEHFDLIYGTSVGAIIGSLISLGEPVEKIIERYYRIIPRVMRRWSASGKTAALRRAAEECFEGKRFDAFKTKIGIVATNYEYRKPMIFKYSANQAHGRHATFDPGFGCTIAEAVVASCAAAPYFRRASVTTTNQGSPILIDGGYVANNPTLFAIADALGPLEIPKECIRVLSVGTGSFREKISFKQWALEKLLPVETVFYANTNTLEIIRNLLFKDIDVVRVDGVFPDKQYETSLIESNEAKLRRLQGLGREAFAAMESEIKKSLL